MRPVLAVGAPPDDTPGAEGKYALRRGTFVRRSEWARQSVDRAREHVGSDLTRRLLADPSIGTAVMGAHYLELPPGGAVDRHATAFQTTFFVVAGEVLLDADGDEYRLTNGSFGLIPHGIQRSWRTSRAGCAWLEFAVPGPRTAAQWDEQVRAVTPGATLPPEFSALGRGEVVIGRRELASHKGPRSKGMFEAVSATGGGLAVEALIDPPDGLQTVILVTLAPGASCPSHDHPFEETFFVLSGSCRFELEDEVDELAAGDFAWAGVGCRHAMRNRSPHPCVWIETQTPRPPAVAAVRLFEQSPGAPHA